MLNSKYNKILSVLLVIGILAIIGLLIFIGIDFYKASSTSSQTKDFFEQFNSYVEGNKPENKEENNILVDNNENNQENTDSNIKIEDDNIVSNNENSGNGNSSSNELTLNGLKVAGTIEIPKTNIKYAILDDSSAKALESGISILYGPGVNKVGNTVLAGHNYRNGTFFSNNKKLSIGDKIYITDMSGKKVTYEIYKKYQTDSNDFSYATRDTNGKREISVSTCTDDSSARLILWAREV